MNCQEIINKLPYSKPFLFVDEISHLDENGAEGCYTFTAASDFYKGHFKNNPVTPGVILTECCAQIGVVSLGIFLLNEDEVSVGDTIQIGLSSSEMEFLEPVFPNEKVTVTSEKVYFRFQKLKCKVKMHNSEGKLVCKGTISGMLKSIKNE
jgi:3-hydroxyacyl-[acyl-carrier-protein] dehydratase